MLMRMIHTYLLRLAPFSHLSSLAQKQQKRSVDIYSWEAERKKEEEGEGERILRY